MGRLIRRCRVTRLTVDGSRSERADDLAVEEPLEVRLGGRPLTVTMRTPGHDVELVCGLLLAEGIIGTHNDVLVISQAGVDQKGLRDRNVLDVQLVGDAPRDASPPRRVYTSSACGVCGAASLDAVRKVSRYPVDQDAVRVPIRQLTSMPEALRGAQRLFTRTGGAHAAALFLAAEDALRWELVCAREDIGRHNAVDKAIGWAMRERGLPLRGAVLQVSGRASFELAQKASMAGIPVLSAVSAPSSLAVELAEEVGLTVVGFNRHDQVNVYSRPERIR